MSPNWGQVYFVSIVFPCEESKKGYIAYYSPVAERILCLVSGFSRIPTPPALISKTGPEPHLIPCQTLRV
jgi:hypothetical protein